MLLPGFWYIWWWNSLSSSQVELIEFYYYGNQWIENGISDLFWWRIPNCLITEESLWITLCPILKMFNASIVIRSLKKISQLWFITSVGRNYPIGPLHAGRRKNIRGCLLSGGIIQSRIIIQRLHTFWSHEFLPGPPEILPRWWTPEQTSVSCLHVLFCPFPILLTGSSMPWKMVQLFTRWVEERVIISRWSDLRDPRCNLLTALLQVGILHGNF